MRGIIHQGESESAMITIKSAQDTYIELDSFHEVEAFLIHTASYKTLASYVLKAKRSGWLKITTCTEPLVGGIIKVSAVETQGIPVGDIDIQINLYVSDPTYTDDHVTKIYKGKLAKMMRAKRQ